MWSFQPNISFQENSSGSSEPHAEEPQSPNLGNHRSSVLNKSATASNVVYHSLPQREYSSFNVCGGGSRLRGGDHRFLTLGPRMGSICRPGSVGQALGDDGLLSPDPAAFL